MSGEIKIEEEFLVFELHGSDAIESLKRHIRIPLDHILSVSTDKVPWIGPGIRIMGTSLPGIVKAGTFISKEGFMFYDVHNPNKCITLALTEEKYKKIIFQVPDKNKTAEMIKKAIESRKRKIKRKMLR